MMTKTTFNVEAARATNPTGDVTPTWDLTSLMTDHVHKLEDARRSSKPVKFIMGADGFVYEMRTTDVGEFMVKTNKVLGADHVQEGFSLNVPKVPFRLLLQTVSFFRDVCDQFNNDEAMLQYWYDTTTNEYSAICLEQTTNKVHVTYLRNEEWEQDPNKVLVMDIHSHNNMAAFFSGTDDASEQETRLYGVIGELDKEIPKLRFRYSVEGKFVEIPMSDIIEMPTMKLSLSADGFDKEIELSPEQLIYPQIDFPKEWLSIIEEGKRSKQRFAGKGNSNTRGIGFSGGRLNPNAGKGWDGWDDMENDTFANADQMRLFMESEQGQQRQRPVQDETYGFEYLSGGEPEEDDTEDQESVVEYFEEVLELCEMNPDNRVNLITAAMRNSSMFETRQIVDVIMDAGYVEEVADMLKNYGYEVRRR